MGQPIAVTSTMLVEDVAMFATDRAVTGQNGASFSDEESAESAGSFPGSLAARLLAGDEAVEHVFVASNQIVARRRDGWDEPSLTRAAETITEFFVFYTDAARP